MPEQASIPASPLQVPKTVAAPPKVAAAVHSASAILAPRPKTLVLGNTNDLVNDTYLRCCIYGETSTRKTTSSAEFAGPERTRIIATRRKEQLIPLRERGYQFAQVEDAAGLRYALMYPEQIWPDWATIPGRSLVLDDATRAVELLVEDATEDVGEAHGRNYMEAGKDLKELIRLNFDKPQHVILTALAKVRENSITNEEQVTIDLPASMKSFLLTELEFVFYIKPNSWVFVTDRQIFTYKDYDPELKKERTFKREIFAKNKLPLALKDKGILLGEEPMSLHKIWEKLKEAKVSK